MENTCQPFFDTRLLEFDELVFATVFERLVCTLPFSLFALAYWRAYCIGILLS